MKTSIFVFSLLALVSLTACQKAADTMTEPNPSLPAMTNETPKVVSVETSMPADKNMEVFSASYSDYQADEAQGQKHILFFHADWCPTCVQWDKKVKENMTNLEDNVVIYKTDYDTADDLKLQYEITKQSTAVFVNADGSVAKTEADPSLESVNAFFAADLLEGEEMGEVDTMKEGSSEAFSATYTDYQAGEAVGQKHIIFFHAAWCPTCVKWEEKVKNQMGDLADNVIILKANYDTETELKTQYGVAQQSTAVFLNADGTVAKTEADPSLESVNAFFAN